MLTPGSLLQNRYEIVQLLGQGGFGAVYRANDRRLTRSVAIKAIYDRSLDFARQFEREARTLANLRHVALPIVTDHFVEADGQYLVMEYVPGESLHEYLSHQPNYRLSESAALNIATPIMDALQYLHTRVPPIIHRDIKPRNIRIADDGRVFLVDFGISKAYDPTMKTTVGARAVTPGFSPLEQYGFGPTDTRADRAGMVARVVWRSRW